MTSHVRVRWVASGRVQGVGFRRFVERCATRHGVAGWVRNRADGAVEIEVEGPAPVVERLRVEVEKGPPGARVTSLESESVVSPEELLPNPFSSRRG
jgi:acylphosphatase